MNDKKIEISLVFYGHNKGKFLILRCNYTCNRVKRGNLVSCFISLQT